MRVSSLILPPSSFNKRCGSVQGGMLLVRYISNLSVKTLIFAIGVTIVAGLAPIHAAMSAAPKVEVPRSWKKVELRDFSFSIPPDMKERDVRGIDSEVWEYRSREMRLAIDYGMYSIDQKSYAEQPGYKSEWVSIDGQRAKVATFRSGKYFVAAAYFSGLWNSDTKLGFSVESKSAAGQELSKKIFQSIRFRR
jgi:hypothetical protein